MPCKIWQRAAVLFQHQGACIVYNEKAQLLTCLFSGEKERALHTFIGFFFPSSCHFVIWEWMEAPRRWFARRNSVTFSDKSDVKTNRRALTGDFCERRHRRRRAVCPDVLGEYIWAVSAPLQWQRALALGNSVLSGFSHWCKPDQVHQLNSIVQIQTFLRLWTLWRFNWDSCCIHEGWRKETVFWGHVKLLLCFEISQLHV